MTLTVRQFLEIVETRFPAPPGDDVLPLLEFGSPRKRIRRIGMTPRLLPEAVPMVLRCNYDLVVTFHPFFGSGGRASLRTDCEPGASAAKLLRAGRAVVCVGERLEAAGLSRDRALADLIALRGSRPIHGLETVESAEVKFAVFVPEGHEEAVIEAIARGGGGVIGRYSHCTFRSPGTGTYRPLEGANPWAGKVGKLESAPETRLEARVPRACLDRVYREVRRVHPYEEMAYDVFPLLELRESARPIAQSVALPRPIRLRTLCARLNRHFVQRIAAAGPETRAFSSRIVSGKPSALVRRIVFCFDAAAVLYLCDTRAESFDAIVRTAFEESASNPAPEGPAIVEIDPSIAEHAVLTHFNSVLRENEYDIVPHGIGMWG